MSSTTSTQVKVTISDEEYSEMLRVRLAAKHAWEAGDITDAEYSQARAVVRRARKVRKQEGAVVENYKQQSAPQHNAMTRKATPTIIPGEMVDERPVVLVKPQERRVKA